VSLRYCFQGYRRIDQSVPEIAQGLPERGAPAGTILDAGKRLGAGLASANHLPERFLEKKVALELQRRAAAFFLELECELIEGQKLDVEQRQAAFPAQENLQTTPQQVGWDQHEQRTE
jgi:hypothetical protein